MRHSSHLIRKQPLSRTLHSDRNPQFPLYRQEGPEGPYLVLVLHLHAVLGPWLYLCDFLSEEEAQASHECICCLIYGRRGSQLLLSVT